jgi:hypothetical protein
MKRSEWMSNGLLQSSITKSKLFMNKLKKPSDEKKNTNSFAKYIILLFAKPKRHVIKTNWN